MPKIVFKEPEGSIREVEAANGNTIMEAAVDNGIDGTLAECGGACACATCHAYIDEAWLARLPEMDDMEDAMLDSALERRKNSRLSCQIEITDELDGLVVTVADN
jgi:2Fe-2S ferredoxin